MGNSCLSHRPWILDTKGPSEHILQTVAVTTSALSTPLLCTFRLAMHPSIIFVINSSTSLVSSPLSVDDNVSTSSCSRQMSFGIRRHTKPRLQISPSLTKQETRFTRPVAERIANCQEQNQAVRILKIGRAQTPGCRYDTSLSKLVRVSPIILVLV